MSGSGAAHDRLPAVEVRGGGVGGRQQAGSKEELITPDLPYGSGPDISLTWLRLGLGSGGGGGGGGAGGGWAGGTPPVELLNKFHLRSPTFCLFSPKLISLSGFFFCLIIWDCLE